MTETNPTEARAQKLATHVSRTLTKVRNRYDWFREQADVWTPGETAEHAWRMRNAAAKSNLRADELMTLAKEHPEHKDLAETVRLVQLEAQELAVTVELAAVHRMKTTPNSVLMPHWPGTKDHEKEQDR